MAVPAQASSRWDSSISDGFQIKTLRVDTEASGLPEALVLWPLGPVPTWKFEAGAKRLLVLSGDTRATRVPQALCSLSPPPTPSLDPHFLKQK